MRRFLGPFLRCHDIFIGHWQTLFDVPDITFRVTQDYDGDGVEEEIYSEGYFDVRWNSGSIPDVTLEASGNALATQQCGPVKEIPCGNVPSIEAAGYLDLEPDYHDDATGFGLRVNRPSPTGAFPPPPMRGSTRGSRPTPVCGEPEPPRLRAAHQRHPLPIGQEYRATPSDAWGASMPLPGRHLDRAAAGPRLRPDSFIPSGDGSYPILPAAVLVHPNWLMPWNTNARPDGTYQLELELGRLTGGGPPAAARHEREAGVRGRQQQPGRLVHRGALAPASASGTSERQQLDRGAADPTRRLPGDRTPDRSGPCTCGSSCPPRPPTCATPAFVQSGCGGGGMVLLDTVETPLQSCQALACRATTTTT